MSHYNGLSPAEAERLAMLAEEAGEVVQAVTKILRHGYEATHPDGGPTNRETLKRELADLAAVQRMMRPDRCAPTMGDIGAAAQRKLRYSHHQSAPS